MFRKELKKILIIEDEKELISSLTTLFEAKGYQVVSAQDGVRGIEITHKEAVDLVILDLGIPAGSGFFVLESLKSTPATRHTPVLVLTGKTQETTEEESYRFGASAYLRKPFDPEELLDWAKKLIEKG